jgi:sugar lactone lactonase YvrE
MSKICWRIPVAWISVVVIGAMLVAHSVAGEAEKGKRGRGKGRRAAAAPQLKKAGLLLELPDSCNTPDGMTLLPSGDIILSVPNFNDKKAPPLLMKITKDNKLEEFYKLPGHPETGRAGPMGICVAPCGDIYLADNQIFNDPDGKPMLYGKSRLVRIVVKDGKATDMVEVVYGFNVSNAVVVREGHVYVTETILEPGSKPLISGVFRFKLGEEKVKLKSPLSDDPHLIATIKTYNEKIPFGADGATFDEKGNMYIGNFSDGTIHKLVFDKNGKVVSNEIFAKAAIMKSCDGIWYDARTKKIYVADSMANAVQMVSLDGTVQTLAQDENNNGAGGRFDQPCEVVVRGKEVIVSNMDFPVPGGVNTTFDKPYTMSIIKLD